MRAPRRAVICVARMEGAHREPASI